ncbi:MAG: NHLP bacteriocin export ABC transporter permease/ATPase subunit [Eggerthellaceae bacterium]|nr:NHLP bacteriocin export ABC transporter permease/ATPase subunit [Eggerthellaceae bacterium]
MSAFSEQLSARDLAEREQFEASLDSLAAAVVGHRAASSMNADDPRQADSAIGAALAYFHLKPTATPPASATLEERLDLMLHPHGIMRRKVRLEGAWYREAIGVMLGHLENGAPVALLPRGSAGYCYVDPSTGRRVIVSRVNASHIAPEAICLYRPLPQRSLTLRDLGVFAMRALDVGDYALILIVSAIATAIGLLPAWANKVIFDKVVPYGDVSLILPVAALLVGVVLSQAVIGIARSAVTSRIDTKLNVQVQAAVMARILLLPPSYFGKHQPGELANRASSITSLVQLLANVVFTTGLSSVFSLVYIGQIVSYTPALVVPAMIVILVNVGVTTAATLANMYYDRHQLENTAGLSGTLVALLSGIQKIKLAGAERRAFTRWAEGYAKVARTIYDRPLPLKASSVIVTAVGLVGVMLIYFFASIAQVSVADYMAFNVAYGLVTGAISSLAGIASQIALIRPTMQLVAPILECSPETHEDAQHVEEITGAVELTGVTFRYDPDSPAIIDGLTLSIHPGDYVAIVGRTGCGKSTLVRLLLGFEQPQQGGIYYDGRDLSTLDVRSLRRHIGVVLQTGRLVSGSIFQNITLSAPHLSMDEAWEAAEMAGIADDIRAMPMGMFTHIAEGSGGISGGQRQRILIARAVAAKPQLLIFDEATSALDNVTQRQVSEALDGLGCTRIVVAHRLSTIRACNRVIVLEDGRIVEDGSYEGLIAKGGIFADLVARQRLA